MPRRQGTAGDQDLLQRSPAHPIRSTTTLERPATKAAHNIRTQITFNMSGGRNALLWGGVAVAGAGGYSLYSAGGDPKVAQKQIER